METRNRKIVGIVLGISGVTIALAGAYLLATTEMVLGGGVIFGAGIADLMLAFWFLRG